MFWKGLSMQPLMMRLGAIGFALVGITWIGFCHPTPGWSQSGTAGGNSSASSIVGVAPAPVGSAGNTMMSSVLLSNGFQQIAVFDQLKQTMAVYHIDPATGDIQLKSVRKLDADFALQEFNLSEPTPTTIRKNVR